MRTILKLALCGATLFLVGVSFLALIETNAWWVRMTDFPRLQYLIALILLLGTLAVSVPVSRRLRLGLGALVLAAIAYNAVKIAPYLPTQDGVAESCSPEDRISILVANVKLGNRESGALLEMVRAREPDLLLALETNEWWEAELANLADGWPNEVSEITGSYFGMHLRSRLPLRETAAVYPVEQDAPAIFATVELPSGDTVRVFGIHPRPPHPDQSSTGRDAELMWAALEAREAESPVLLAGDLNAVPWERTIERMQRIGGFIDPRESLGFMPSYDAHSWWMSWPLDQVLHQRGLSVLSMEVLPGFGSDHYPVEAVLCHSPTPFDPPELRDDDLAEARTTIAAALEGQPDDR
ncbi:endonuclease/exonuclease/phosphatase family protein [uncultured Jannaschia sp.]|uniref:endonuclease/exonuclease/phosphatase family protein n=1 Tax=uncultured Jannaschia sp. TaxID=293347 RepID=UPI00261AC284|nr:endonuclease/exonuclease/phosphatase family protein [uncultured Jannaschia sp.]